MKSSLLFLLILSATVITSHSLSAQTRLINHRSHSGSDRTFTPDGRGNFGLGHEWPIVLPDSTESPDTLQVSKPQLVEPDPASSPEPDSTGGVTPEISKEAPAGSIAPTDQAGFEVRDPSEQEPSDLFWLGLLLFVPSVSIAVMGMRRQAFG